jgi:hypothetical protein
MADRGLTLAILVNRLHVRLRGLDVVDDADSARCC